MAEDVSLFDDVADVAEPDIPLSNDEDIVVVDVLFLDDKVRELTLAISRLLLKGMDVRCLVDVLTLSIPVVNGCIVDTLGPRSFDVEGCIVDRVRL